MRITCPNCEAHYEVDAGLIPASGRDVQCSNCGRTWFQEAPVPENDIQLAPPAPAPEPVAEPEPEPDPVPEAQAEPDPTPQPEPVAEAEPSDEDVAEAETPAPEPRKHDESILGILREEAEREIAARRAEEQSALESQPELGLAEELRTGPETHQLGDHMAKLRGDADPKADPDTPRSELLPDIDEINSTLTASTAEEQAVAAALASQAQHRRGFRLGFSLIALIVAGLIFLYMFSGAIASSVPSLEPAIAGYVDGANAVRTWIDGVMGSVIGG